MRWFEYKMEVDDLHASDDLKAKLLAMQSQQAVLAPAAKTVTRKQPEVPAHKKALHFPSSRVWKGLAACAAFCVVAGGAASVLHLGVIGVGGAKSSGPATFSPVWPDHIGGFKKNQRCLAQERRKHWKDERCAQAFVQNERRPLGRICETGRNPYTDSGYGAARHAMAGFKSG